MEWSRRARLRIYLLESLKDGPISREWFADRMGRKAKYTSQELGEAAICLGIFTHTVESDDYWVLPEKLTAIWWHAKPKHVQVWTTI